MVPTLLVLGLIIAGFVVVFTQLREETKLQRLVDAIPYPISHAINCPFCLSYWLGLIAAILIDPFAGWDVPWRFTASVAWLEPLFHIIAGWFTLGLIANGWRVLYMLIGKDMSLADLKAKELREELND